MKLRDAGFSLAGDIESQAESVAGVKKTGEKEYQEKINKTPVMDQEQEKQEPFKQPMIQEIARTKDPDNAVQILFEKAIPMVSVLNRVKIEENERDWARSYTNVSLFWGTREEIEAHVLRHFRSFTGKHQFRGFTIEINRRWNCAVADSFANDVANRILVWCETDSFALAGSYLTP